VDEERPLRSALMLSNADGDDGRWTAEDIYRSTLSADLVVLSACSTAAGATAPGEGVMSLSRAFLYAGAGATIATLWSVPDKHGPAFADALYRELANGQPLGAAAAAARRELRRLGAPPRAWAAYVVTGHPDARVGVLPPVPDRTRTAALGGGALIALLLGAKLLLSRA
jgi:CHAT domain-containing protein